MFLVSIYLFIYFYLMCLGEPLPQSVGAPLPTVVVKRTCLFCLARPARLGLNVPRM